MPAVSFTVTDNKKSLQHLNYTFHKFAFYLMMRAIMKDVNAFNKFRKIIEPSQNGMECLQGQLYNFAVTF